MKRTIKFLLLLMMSALALFLVYLPFSPKTELEKRLIATMEQAGLTDVEMTLSSIATNRIYFDRLAFRKNDIAVDMGGLNILADHLPLREIIDGEYDNIKGTWSLDSLNISGIPYALPTLKGAGGLAFLANRPVVSGLLESDDKQYGTQFRVDWMQAKAEYVNLMWEGAKISIKDITYNLESPTPVYLVLNVERLDIARFLTLITSGKASGTGMISGVIPVVIAPDGGFMPGSGKFESNGEGMLSMDPAVLRGEGEQMQMARDALSNFHYKKLSLLSNTSNEGKLSLGLRLEGNNPDMFDGKQINLNVNLTGDVLELLEQTLIPSADPRKFMER